MSALPVSNAPALAPDPFTMTAKLCDDDGYVRGGAMHHGEDYACTGHAHHAGEHIRCTSPAHAQPLPGQGLVHVVRDEAERYRTDLDELAGA